MNTIFFFDWDGTLVDTLGIKIENAAHLFAEQFGLPAENFVEVYRQRSGIPRRDLFEALCVDNGLACLLEEQYALLSAEFTRRNLAAMLGERLGELLKPDTLPALQALQALGCPLYISSSVVSGELRKIAEALGVAAYFKGIFGSEPGFTKGKDHIHYAIPQAERENAAIYFVGDDAADIRLAKQAGVRAVARIGTHSAEELREFSPDLYVNHLMELIALVGDNR